MPLLYFITHPEVTIDPTVSVRKWSLSGVGVERSSQMLHQPWMGTIERIFSSTETKAVEMAEIVSRHIGLPFIQHEELGEIDRDATGYLPLREFEAVVKEFFAHPNVSIKGWEKASNAQQRIVAALNRLLNEQTDKNVAVISHGGVGALALSHYLGQPISQDFDQPGSGGGNYFVVDTTTKTVIHGWQPIES